MMVILPSPLVALTPRSRRAIALRTILSAQPTTRTLRTAGKSRARRIHGHPSSIENLPESSTHGNHIVDIGVDHRRLFPMINSAMIYITHSSRRLATSVTPPGLSNSVPSHIIENKVSVASDLVVGLYPNCLLEYETSYLLSLTFPMRFYALSCIITLRPSSLYNQILQLA